MVHWLLQSPKRKREQLFCLDEVARSRNEWWCGARRIYVNSTQFSTPHMNTRIRGFLYTHDDAQAYNRGEYISTSYIVQSLLFFVNRRATAGYFEDMYIACIVRIISERNLSARRYRNARACPSFPTSVFACAIHMRIVCWYVQRRTAYFGCAISHPAQSIEQHSLLICISISSSFFSRMRIDVVIIKWHLHALFRLTTGE